MSMDNKIKIGINPLSWMCSDFPSLGKEITIGQCLSEAAAAGYSGIEIEDRFHHQPELVKAMLKQQGLQGIGGWLSITLLEDGFDATLRLLREHCRMLRIFGAKMVVLAECTGAIHRDPHSSLASRPVMDNSQWDLLATGLDRLTEEATALGFDVAYHHHMGTVVQDAKDIERLMEQTTKLPLLFDTGHLLYAGVDPEKVLEEYGNRISHVHFKAVRPEKLTRHRKAGSSFHDAIIDGVFTVPGDPESGNAIAFDKMLHRLVERGYSGWIVVEAEQDPAIAEPARYVSLAAAAVRWWHQQAVFAVGQELRSEQDGLLCMTE